MSLVLFILIWWLDWGVSAFLLGFSFFLDFIKLIFCLFFFFLFFINLCCFLLRPYLLSKFFIFSIFLDLFEFQDFIYFITELVEYFLFFYFMFDRYVFEGWNAFASFEVQGAEFGVELVDEGFVIRALEMTLIKECNHFMLSAVITIAVLKTINQLLISGWWRTIFHMIVGVGCGVNFSVLASSKTFFSSNIKEENAVKERILGLVG